MIRRCNGDCVNILRSEHLAEIPVTCRRVPKNLLDAARKLLKEVAVHVADVSDFRILFVRLQRGEVGVRAAMKADHSEVQALIRA